MKPDLPNLPTQHARLKWARTYVAKLPSMRAAARKFGWNENTYKSHEQGIRKVGGLAEEDVRKYARAFGVPRAWIATGQVGDSVESLSPVGVRDVPIRGNVQAGQWAEAMDEAFERDPDDFSTLTISPPSGFERTNLFALRVKGDSMNLEFPDGSVVIVCPTSETEVREDDFVVVLRRKATLAEATIKQLIKHKKQWALAARSTNPQFKEPWVLKGEQDDEPEIVGVIVAFQKNIQRPPATYNGKRAPRK